MRRRLAFYVVLTAMSMAALGAGAAPASAATPAACQGATGYSFHSECPSLGTWTKSRGDAAGSSCPLCQDVVYSKAPAWRWTSVGWRAAAPIPNYTWVYAAPSGYTGWSWGYRWDTREWVLVQGRHLIVCGYPGQGSAAYRTCRGE